MRKNLILLALAAVNALGAPIGYVINFSGQFGTMDLANGAFTPLGPGVSSNSAGGLAGTPGGPFYGVDATGQLLRFSAAGAVTVVGDTGTGLSEGPNGISVMGGLTTGSVFALDFSNNLFSVNTSTGALLLLGNLALPAQENQYDGNMTTSFNGDGTFLYYTLEISGGPNQTGPTLFRINPGTLQVDSRAIAGLTTRVIGSGFVGGIFYAFTDEGQIVQIDPSTGVATVTGGYDAGVPPGGGPPFNGVFGVVATPEPASIWLSGIAGVAVAMARRRRRR